MSTQNNTPSVDGPEEPNPEASYEAVQEYLVKFSRDMCGFSHEEALAWAKKLQVNGRGLYQVDENELIELYGIPGRLLFSQLQNSVYGRACPYLTSPYDMIKITNKHSSVPKSMALLSVGWNRCCTPRSGRGGHKLLEGLYDHCMAFRRRGHTA